MPNVKTRYDDVDVVVVRENTEGLYSGIENEIGARCRAEPQDRHTRRVHPHRTDSPLNMPSRRGRKRRVTVFHKANIMKMSDGLFLECARRKCMEPKWPRTMHLRRTDHRQRLHATGPGSKRDSTCSCIENLYGDIVISDLVRRARGGSRRGAGAQTLVHDCAVFEAVHGSAPDIGGDQDLANPLALIMSGVMMLNHLGLTSAGDRIRDAYDAVLAEGDPAKVTRDIGGKAGTKAFTNAVIAQMT
jgi:isocitrate dehydrogenase (NAD+)